VSEMALAIFYQPPYSWIPFCSLAFSFALLP
jgi:hypothetical protein